MIHNCKKPANKTYYFTLVQCIILDIVSTAFDFTVLPFRKRGHQAILI